jgi:hypothetical protein
MKFLSTKMGIIISWLLICFIIALVGATIATYLSSAIGWVCIIFSIIALIALPLCDGEGYLRELMDLFDD